MSYHEKDKSGDEKKRRREEEKKERRKAQVIWQFPLRLLAAGAT
jgi:hypothetical protein